MSKTHSLMAEAKITLFEVEVVFLDSSRLLSLCGITKPSVRTVLLFEGARKAERKVPACGSDEGPTHRGDL